MLIEDILLAIVFCILVFIAVKITNDILDEEFDRKRKSAPVPDSRQGGAFK